jgi:hypothetical protein
MIHNWLHTSSFRTLDGESKKYAHRVQGDFFEVVFRSSFSLCTCWWTVAAASDLKPVRLCFLLDSSAISDAKLCPRWSCH